MSDETLRRIEELHTPINYGDKYLLSGDMFDRQVCDYCDDLNWSTEGLDSKDEETAWPCRTVRVARGEA